MEYTVGITLALRFCGAAAGLGMDRERVFYPAVLIAVASNRLAFAVVDGRSEVMRAGARDEREQPGFDRSREPAPCDRGHRSAQALGAWSCPQQGETS